LAAITFELGAMGVFIAITSAEVLLAVISIVWFKKGNWKKVQV
jgi:Na+-driven multidrug efflux pump